MPEKNRGIDVAIVEQLQKAVRVPDPQIKHQTRILGAKAFQGLGQARPNQVMRDSQREAARAPLEHFDGAMMCANELARSINEGLAIT